MTLLEKELEDFIFNDFVENGGRGLCERGFTPTFVMQGIRPKIVRQLNIDPYGILDIACLYRFRGKIVVEIFELKAVPIECEHFEQIFRYAKGMGVYLENTFKGNIEIEYFLHLIGSGFSSGHYIQSNVPVSVTEYSYDLGGIEFKYHHGNANWNRPDGANRSFRKHLIDGKKVQ